jgi:Tol biopolymer transport system component
MSIEPGQELLHYELLEQIGEGGMGVVWRGRDTKLDRAVAIKILPDDFAQNPDRLARFAREAKLLASINHGNIATIHGLEQDAGVHFLAMELIEGEDLAARIGRGAISIEEALPLAQQIASALEAAHEQGVIHRDLKPANVKVTPEGNVKVLDFGLAKAFGPDSSDPMTSPTLSPTVTSAGSTAIGVILGTAAYMSPEQAKGKPVDRRADIWSFGVVLMEMLTGRLLFRGESVPETIAAVLMAEPDLSGLPANTPPKVRRLLERCLRKDPQSRLRDIGDARVVIEEALAGHEWKNVAAADAAVRPARLSAQTMLFPGLPLLILGLLVGTLWLGRLVSRGPVSRGGPVHVSMAPDAFGVPFISPDGSRVAWPVPGGGIRVRDLSSPETRLLPGTEEVGWVQPQFSPDGAWVSFVREGRMFKAPADGSSLPVEIGDWPWSEWWYVWLEDDRILTGQDDHFIRGIHASDGTPLPEVEVKGFRGTNFFRTLRPFSGDPRYALGCADSFGEDGTWQMNVVVVDVTTGESSRLIEDAGLAAVSPSGHLVFSRGNDLLAAPFDDERREITGSPVTLGTGLGLHDLFLTGYFDLAANGTMVYTRGPARKSRRIVTADRDGVIEVWSDTKRHYESLSVSPTGKHLITQLVNWREGLQELWISELDHPRLRPLVDVPGVDCHDPVWSYDGTRIAYNCGPKGGLQHWVTSIDGSTDPHRIPKSGAATHLVLGFHPDDRSVLAVVSNDDGQRELHQLPIDDGGETAENPKILAADLKGWGHLLSPDGQCIAYQRNHTGKTEVYVRCLEASGKLGVETAATPNGGVEPLWLPSTSSDPLVLRYVHLEDETFGIWRLDVRARARVEISEPTLVFPNDSPLYKAAKEGRFSGDRSGLPDGGIIMIEDEERPDSDDWFHLVLDFPSELRARVPR